MKIAELTTNKLVLKDTPFTAFSICLLFIGIGLLLKINPNIFLQTPPPIFSTFLIIAGIVVVLIFFSYSIVTFNKMKNELKITRYGLMGFGTKSYFINKITQVHYRLESYGNAANRPGQLELHFNDGSKVPLTLYRSSDNFRRNREIGARVSNFLGVQYIRDEIKDIKDGNSVFYD